MPSLLTALSYVILSSNSCTIYYYHTVCYWIDRHSNLACFSDLLISSILQVRVMESFVKTTYTFLVQVFIPSLTSFQVLLMSTLPSKSSGQHTRDSNVILPFGFNIVHHIHIRCIRIKLFILLPLTFFKPSLTFSHIPDMISTNVNYSKRQDIKYMIAVIYYNITDLTTNLSISVIPKTLMILWCCYTTPSQLDVLRRQSLPFLPHYHYKFHVNCQSKLHVTRNLFTLLPHWNISTTIMWY